MTEGGNTTDNFKKTTITVFYQEINDQIERIVGDSGCGLSFEKGY